MPAPAAVVARLSRWVELPVHEHIESGLAGSVVVSLDGKIVGVGRWVAVRVACGGRDVLGINRRLGAPIACLVASLVVATSTLLLLLNLLKDSISLLGEEDVVRRQGTAGSPWLLAPRPLLALRVLGPAAPALGLLPHCEPRILLDGLLPLRKLLVCRHGAGQRVISGGGILVELSDAIALALLAHQHEKILPRLLRSVDEGAVLGRKTAIETVQVLQLQEGLLGGAHSRGKLVGDAGCPGHRGGWRLADKLLPYMVHQLGMVGVERSCHGHPMGRPGREGGRARNRHPRRRWRWDGEPGPGHCGCSLGTSGRKGSRPEGQILPLQLKFSLLQQDGGPELLPLAHPSLELLQLCGVLGRDLDLTSGYGRRVARDLHGDPVPKLLDLLEAGRMGGHRR